MSQLGRQSSPGSRKQVGLGTEKFSLSVGIFYDTGLNFDSSKMIYINTLQRIKEMMTN